MADGEGKLRMKRKIICIVAAFLMLMSLVNIACAAEKVVQLTVPGCFS